MFWGYSSLAVGLVTQGTLLAASHQAAFPGDYATKGDGEYSRELGDFSS